MVFKNIFILFIYQGYLTPTLLPCLFWKKKNPIVYNLAVKCCPQQPPKLQTEEQKSIFFFFFRCLGPSGVVSLLRASVILSHENFRAFIAYRSGNDAEDTEGDRQKPSVLGPVQQEQLCAAARGLSHRRLYRVLGWVLISQNYFLLGNSNNSAHKGSWIVWYETKLKQFLHKGLIFLGQLWSG